MHTDPMPQALARFGLGRQISLPWPSDATAWLTEQVRSSDPRPGDGRTTTAEGLKARLADFEQKPPPGQGEGVKLFQLDAKIELTELIVARSPYRERLVAFWSNHFTVSRRNGGVGPIAGAYVRDAIRPHVTGRFHDMLLAVMRHPAMLLYLDNATSVGPHSKLGSQSGRGLNENLARESLELHTVSPAAGYSQADVTSYAAVITGWSVDMKAQNPGFVFRPKWQEPGPKTMLGQTFPEGEQGGIEALAFLASHPATHRHLATKLVRHFVADDPPSDAVTTIEGVLRDTDGDLGAASIALISLPGAWVPFTKLRSPQDYMLAVMRGVDLPQGANVNLLGVVTNLGQPPFGAAFPIGWPDTAVGWAGSEEIMRRIDWAYDVSGVAAQKLSPQDVAVMSLGSLLQPATMQAIRHAGSRQEALALLFTSPEFQRR